MLGTFSGQHFCLIPRRTANIHSSKDTAETIAPLFKRIPVLLPLISLCKRYCMNSESVTLRTIIGVPLITVALEVRSSTELKAVHKYRKVILVNPVGASHFDDAKGMRPIEIVSPCV